MQESNVELAGGGQWSKFPRSIVLQEVSRQIVTMGMQNVVTGGFFFRRGPVVTFVLIAFVTGVYQILKFVRAFT